MRTLTIKVQSFEEAKEQSLAAARLIDAGEGYQGEVHGFETIEQLFAHFTPRRWTVIGALQRHGPMSLRGLARLLGRDVKRLHEDVAVLLDDGVIERNEDQKLFVPYANIHIAVDLKAPAAA